MHICRSKQTTMQLPEIVPAIKKYRLILWGVLAGAVGGYLYYYFIGCSSGSCAITSNALHSTVYGAVLGGLLMSNFKTTNKTSEHSSLKNKQQ